MRTIKRAVGRAKGRDSRPVSEPPALSMHPPGRLPGEGELLLLDEPAVLGGQLLDLREPGRVVEGRLAEDLCREPGQMLSRFSLGLRLKAQPTG